MSSPDSLHPLQRRAIDVCDSPASRLFVLTGMPGTGKTTVLRDVAAKFRSQRKRVLVVSLTNRAVQRAQRSVGDLAACETMHTVIWRPEVAAKHKGSVLVFEEASQVPMDVAGDVCDAIAPSRIVVTGDPDQTWAIDSLSLLVELLACRDVLRLNWVELTHVYRNASREALFANICAVREATFMTCASFKEDESFAVKRVDTSDVGALTAAVRESLSLTKRPPQFISLTHETRAVINATVQSSVNRANERFAVEGHPTIWFNDAVVASAHHSIDGVKIVTKGTLGRVRSPRKIEWDNGFVDEAPFRTKFDLGYCVTVSSLQGEQFPSVVFAFDAQKWPKEKTAELRRLLFTAISRAEERATLFVRDDGVLRAATSCARGADRKTSTFEVAVRQLSKDEENVRDIARRLIPVGEAAAAAVTAQDDEGEAKAPPSGRRRKAAENDAEIYRKRVKRAAATGVGLLAWESEDDESSDDDFVC